MMQFLLFAAVIGLADARPRAVALVDEVHGAVQVERASGKTQPLEEGDRLRPGERVRVPAAGAVWLRFWKDGHRERIKAGCTATVGKLGCQPRTAVEIKPRTQAERQVLQGLKEIPDSRRSATTVARGTGSDQAPAIVPIQGSRILNVRPEFRWPAVPKAKSYLVMLNFTTGRKMWTHDQTARQAHLGYPADQQPLPAGREFRWQVLARLDEQWMPCAEGTFATLPAKKAGLLAELKKQAESNDRADVFEAAVLYSHDRVYDQAIAAYERLCKMAPDRQVFRRTLADLYDLAGRPRDAARLRSGDANKKKARP